MDYKEYSRLRAIASKRLKRAAAAGYNVDTHVPTVKEVRASKNPADYMKAVKRFLNDNDSKLSVVRKTGGSYAKIEVKPSKPRKPLTDAQKAKKKFQNRLSKAKRAIEKSADSEENAKHRALYWKGVNKLLARWKEKGVEDDVVNWVYGMSPSTAKKFMDYVEYRLSQGDYKTVYTVDTFVQDFAEMLKKGYNISDIQNDFDSFLMKQKELAKRKEETNEYGLTAKEANKYWRKYVGREEEE